MLVTFVAWFEMAALLISGVAGAIVAAVIWNFGPLEDGVIVQLPIINMGLGFVLGVVVWFALSFLRIRVIRLLLSYDHWFIGKPNFVDYVSDLFSRSLRACQYLFTNTAMGYVFKAIDG